MQAKLRLWWHLPSYVDRILHLYCLIPSTSPRWGVSHAAEAAAIDPGLVAAPSGLVFRLETEDSVQERSGTLYS